MVLTSYSSKPTFLNNTQIIEHGTLWKASLVKSTYAEYSRLFLTKHIYSCFPRKMASTVVFLNTSQFFYSYYSNFHHLVHQLNVYLPLSPEHLLCFCSSWWGYCYNSHHIWPSCTIWLIMYIISLRSTLPGIFNTFVLMTTWLVLLGLN